MLYGIAFNCLVPVENICKVEIRAVDMKYSKYPQIRNCYRLYFVALTIHILGMGKVSVR